MHHRRPLGSTSLSPTTAQTSSYHGPESKPWRGRGRLPRRSCRPTFDGRCIPPLLLMLVPIVHLGLHSSDRGPGETSMSVRRFSNDLNVPKSGGARGRMAGRGEDDIRRFLSRRPRISTIVGSDMKDRRSHGNNLDEDSVMQTKKQKRALLDSEDYDHKGRDSLYEGDCEPMHPWQEALFPSCNKIHEMGMAYAVSDFVSHARDGKVAAFSKINSGGYNDVFLLHGDPPVDEDAVLKILGFGTEYTDRNFDRVRRDAVISERLTRSSFVVNVYGHCGLSELAPLGRGGTLSDTMTDSNDAETKLRLATEAASGLADMHNIDGDGISAVSHGDLKADQYLMVDGAYRLGDFNRGRFIRRNKKTGEPCPYTIGHNDAKYRSPEEYRYDPETSKIDCWALGSILFQILTGEKVWHGVPEKKAQKSIKGGASPPLSDKWKDTTDPVDVLLRKVMYEMCFVPDPTKRSSAVEIADFLKAEARKLGQ